MKPKKLFHAIVVVGATLAGGCGDDTTTDAGTDAGARIADAAMDAAAEPEDAGAEDEDAMVLIL